MAEPKRAIWDYLKAKGLNDFAVAGVMGNLRAESALNPRNVENSYEKKLGYNDDTYTAAVDAGTYAGFVRDSAGYGLAQWTFWTRKEKLLKFVKAQGASVGDLTAQLGYLWIELTEYSAVMKVLLTAKSVREASDAFMCKFENPADQSEAAKKRRASYGQAYYDEFAGKGSAGQSSGTHAQEKPAAPPATAFKPYAARITTKESNLNVRGGPGTDNPIVGKLAKGATATITEETGGWGRTSKGWISLDYTTKV